MSKIGNFKHVEKIAKHKFLRFGKLRIYEIELNWVWKLCKLEWTAENTAEIDVTPNEMNTQK